jgi:hypothetical protein
MNAGFSFSHQVVQGLERVTPDQLVDVEIAGMGYALHWEGLEVDLPAKAGCARFLMAVLKGAKMHQ